MLARSLPAAALAAAAVTFAAPSAEACDSCGYDPCPCVQPVVVADPCCEPPRLSHRERAAARRLARLERREDRIRDRFAPDPCCAPVAAAPTYSSGYSYNSYQSSYTSAGYGHGGFGGAGHGGFGHGGHGGYGPTGGYGHGY